VGFGVSVGGEGEKGELAKIWKSRISPNPSTLGTLL